MTKSIPIIRSSNRSADEDSELRHNALVADYKDYVFFQRVIEGMRRRQDHTHDIALRYENQALIDHIIRTRHCPTDSRERSQDSIMSTSPTSIRNFREEERSTPTSFRKSELCRVRSRADMISQVQDAVHICNSAMEEEDGGDDEDDYLIFDLDL